MGAREQLNTVGSKKPQAAETLLCDISARIFQRGLTTGFSWARISLHSSKKISVNTSTFLIPKIIIILDGSLFENGNVLLDI